MLSGHAACLRADRRAELRPPRPRSSCAWPNATAKPASRIGLGANNQVVEVFASLETGTWTITVTLPDGTTCLVASGQAYESLTDPLPAPGSDA